VDPDAARGPPRGGAALAVFLASEEASYITGQVIRRGRPASAEEARKRMEPDTAKIWTRPRFA